MTQFKMMQDMGLGKNAEGAISCGTKVLKVNSESGDGNPDGTEAIVCGSLRITNIMKDDVKHPSGRIVDYIYFVIFPNSNISNVPVGIMDYKIQLK